MNIEQEVRKRKCQYCEELVEDDINSVALCGAHLRWLNAIMFKLIVESDEEDDL